jgi:hypothetical protein
MRHIKQVSHIFEITGLMHGRPLVKMVAGCQQPFKENQYMAIYREENGRKFKGTVDTIEKIEDIGFMEAIKHIPFSTASDTESLICQ